MLRKTLYQPILALVFLTCVLSSPLKAQNQSPSENSWTVQSETLDVKAYEQIARALKTQTEFKVKEACVPAGLIVFELKESAQMNSDLGTQLLAHLHDLTELSDFELSGLTFEEFREQCAASRLRPANK